MDLATVLVLVRFAHALFTVSLGPNSWMRAWELRLTFVIWAAIAFQVLGWFNGIERTLDSIDLIPGKTQFSLWSLLKGIVVIVGFLIVTSLIARTIERRVMKLEGLAISTRIGISKFSTFVLIGLGVLLGINASGVDLTVLGRVHRRDRPRPGFRPAGHRQQFRLRLRAAAGQIDQARRRHQLHRHHGHQHRELRLGAGAARPLHRGSRPRRRRNTGAEPEPHHQLGHQLELLRPARAHPPAGDDQLPGRSGSRAAGAASTPRRIIRASSRTRARSRGS